MGILQEKKRNQTQTRRQGNQFPEMKHNQVATYSLPAKTPKK